MLERANLGKGELVSQAEETLSGIGILLHLPRGNLEALAKRCQWSRYAAKQQIIGHADKTQDVFFVVTGEVRVTIYSSSGKEVTFRDIGAGNLFGELAAIDGKPRSAAVVALADTLIASMPANVFLELSTNDPAVSIAIQRSLAGLVRILTERVYEFSTLMVKNRIRAELLRLARDHVRSENTAEISPVPTHADIASRVSTHREAVTRELNALERVGLIERHDGTLIICDVARLARSVEEVLGK